MSPSNKVFKIPGDQIRKMIPNMGGCMASDRIMVEGMPVGYMTREKPDNNALSGWIFMSGDESQAYADNPDNWGIYNVNTVCNYDPAVIPYLQSGFNTAWGRRKGTDEFICEVKSGPKKWWQFWR